MGFAYPKIGKWFRRPDGTLLEVVAVDESADTIEIQMFDGTIDEFEIESWRDQLLIEVQAPEDWTGPMDMDPDDYKGTAAGEMPSGFHDPLEFLEKD
ncbi:MAG: hypothetical protein P8X81_02945 [Woeseiaceae bacterium]|jgi:hypothetical protein